MKAADKTTVVGTHSLMAGAIQQVSAGDFSQAVKGNRLAAVSGNVQEEIAGNLSEQIGQLRKSIAGARQDIIAPVVWIGSGQVNIAQCLLDTLDLVKSLADTLASHSHPGTGNPNNSGEIAAHGSTATALNGKYSPIIG